jgi:hypothetical protein
MESPEEPRKPRSLVLLVGGTLTIISGMLALITGVLLAVIGNSYGLLVDTGGAQIAVCGIATIILGIPAIIGGVCAIKRKHFSMAVAGAFTGMAAGGLWIGFFLGLAALILYAFSNEDL